MIDEAADRHGIDRNLAHTVAQMESRYNPRARSPVGAMGVMQLMPATARSLGVSDPFDPGQNIEGGVKYLAQLSNRYGGDPKLVMAAYNAGPGAVDKYGGVPPYRETRNYVTTGMRKLGTGTGSAARSAIPPDTEAAASVDTVPAAPADGASPDVLERIMRGEKVKVTPQDILQIAFGPTGTEKPALTVTKNEPLAITKSEPLPAPPPQQPAPPGFSVERMANIIGESSGLKTLEGLVGGGGQALLGRITGSPDYAAEQRFGNAVQGVATGLRDEPSRIWGELTKSGEAMTKGDINAAADHLWFAVPMLGAAGAKMKEYLDKGDYWGALAHATGTVGGAVTASPEARTALVETAAEAPGAIAAAASETATRAAGAAKTAARKAAGAATILDPDLVGIVSPRAAHTLRTIQKVGKVIDKYQTAKAAAGAAATETTPGQAYAASQGIDWETLNTTDRATLEQVAAAQRNVAEQQPAQAAARPAPEATPAPAPPKMTREQRRATDAELWGKIQQGDFADTAQTGGLMGVAKGIRARGGLETAEDFAALRQDFEQIPQGRDLGEHARGLVQEYSPEVPQAPPPAAETPAAPQAPTRTLNDIHAEFSQRLANVQEMAKRAGANGSPQLHQQVADEMAALRQLYREQPVPPGSMTSEPVVQEAPPQAPPETLEAALSGATPASPPAPINWSEVARNRKVDALFDVATKNRIRLSMMEKFGEKQWQMLADHAGVKLPSETTIAQLKQRLADYEKAQNIPVTKTTTPAEAQAAFNKAKKTRRRTPPER